MKTNTYDNPVVVSYMSYSGLAIVRSFGRKGIPVYAIDPNKNQVGMNSKYCESIVCPSIEQNEADHIDFLKNLARKAGKKPVLFAAGDNTVLCYGKHEDTLREHFVYTNAAKDKVNKLVPKIEQYKTAVEVGLEIPQSFSPKDRADLRNIYSALQKPFIIRPSRSNTWYEAKMSQVVSHQKCILVNDFDELLRWYDLLTEQQNQIMLSDIIPGDDRNLYYAPSYRSLDGVIKGIFVGQKTRILPIHFGSASYAELCKNDEVIEITKKMLTRLDYFGLSGVEYKYDPRDGKYKFIEFNARYGLWDCLGEVIGIDLPYIAYCDVLGIQSDGVGKEDDGNEKKGAWICFERDIRALRAYKNEDSLKYKEWLASILRVKKCSILDLSDLKPFFKVAARNFLGNMKSIIKILWARFI